MGKHKKAKKKSPHKSKHKGQAINRDRPLQGSMMLPLDHSSEEEAGATPTQSKGISHTAGKNLSQTSMESFVKEPSASSAQARKPPPLGHAAPMWDQSNYFAWHKEHRYSTAFSKLQVHLMKTDPPENRATNPTEEPHWWEPRYIEWFISNGTDPPLQQEQIQLMLTEFQGFDYAQPSTQEVDDEIQSFSGDDESKLPPCPVDGEDSLVHDSETETIMASPSTKDVTSPMTKAQAPGPPIVPPPDQSTDPTQGPPLTHQAKTVAKTFPQDPPATDPINLPPTYAHQATKGISFGTTQVAFIPSPPRPIPLRLSNVLKHYKLQARKFKFTVRYDLRLYIPPQPSFPTRMTTIRDKLAATFDTIKSVDSTALLLPWQQNSSSPPEEEPNSIPAEQRKLQIYYGKKAYAPPGGATIYPSLFLAHTTDPTTLLADVNRLLQSSKASLSQQPLQTDEILQVGWFLFSVDNQDTAHLSQWFLQKGIRAHFRNRIISVTTRGQGRSKEMTEDEKIRALHIEIPASSGRPACRAIREAYSADATTFPYNTRMRLLPTMDEPLINDATKQKILRCRAIQSSFNQKMIRMPFYHLIEGALSMHDNQLRATLMTITARGTTKCLFHSVDSSWRVGEHFFTFHPSVQKEATEVVNGILAYLKYMVGPSNYHQVERYFTNQHVLIMRDNSWDPLRHAVVSDFDRNTARLLGDNDADLLELADGDDPMLQGTETSIVDNLPASSNQQIDTQAHGDASVSTTGLRTKASAARTVGSISTHGVASMATEGTDTDPFEATAKMSLLNLTTDSNPKPPTALTTDPPATIDGIVPTVKTAPINAQGVPTDTTHPTTLSSLTDPTQLDRLRKENEALLIAMEQQRKESQRQAEALAEAEQQVDMERNIAQKSYAALKAVMDREKAIKRENRALQRQIAAHTDYAEATPHTPSRTEPTAGQTAPTGSTVLATDPPPRVEAKRPATTTDDSTIPLLPEFEREPELKKPKHQDGSNQDTSMHPDDDVLDESELDRGGSNAGVPEP